MQPILHAVSSPAELNTSARQMYEAFTKPGAAGTGGGCWVDVRDIALAHARALQKQAAGGERIIVAAGAFKWQDWRSYPGSSSFILPLTRTPHPSRRRSCLVQLYIPTRHARGREGCSACAIAIACYVY